MRFLLLFYIFAPFVLLVFVVLPHDVQAFQLVRALLVDRLLPFLVVREVHKVRLLLRYVVA